MPLPVCPSFTVKWMSSIPNGCGFLNHTYSKCGNAFCTKVVESSELKAKEASIQLAGKLCLVNVLISQLFGELKVNKTKRDSRSGLLIGLTASALVPFGGVSGAQADAISREAMAQEIITILAQPRNQERIRKILIDSGLNLQDVKSLVSALSPGGCREVVAAEGGSGSRQAAIIQAVESLLVYAQPERLEVIYRKVRGLPEDQIAIVGGGV